jgi:hypothetical protein
MPASAGAVRQAERSTSAAISSRDSSRLFSVRPVKQTPAPQQQSAARARERAQQEDGAGEADQRRQYEDGGRHQSLGRLSRNASGKSRTCSLGFEKISPITATRYLA